MLDNRTYVCYNIIKEKKVLPESREIEYNPIQKGEKAMRNVKGNVFRGIIRMCERVAASGGTPTPYSA